MRERRTPSRSRRACVSPSPSPLALGDNKGTSSHQELPRTYAFLFSSAPGAPEGALFRRQRRGIRKGRRGADVGKGRRPPPLPPSPLRFGRSCPPQAPGPPRLLRQVRFTLDPPSRPLLPRAGSPHRLRPPLSRPAFPVPSVAVVSAKPKARLAASRGPEVLPPLCPCSTVGFPFCLNRTGSQL